MRPVVHYTMGGIHTDIDAPTPLPGLFAAGECACVSINGANRLGSNSLAEMLVFGARAGRGAAAFAKANKLGASGAGGSEAPTRPRPWSAICSCAPAARETDVGPAQGNERHHGKRRRDLSQRRHAAGSLRHPGQLRSRYGKLQLEDRSNVFNTDLLQALELGSMLEVAQAMACSAVQRTKSRGSHQRLDHPARNDVKFLKHSLASYWRSGAAGHQL